MVYDIFILSGTISARIFQNQDWRLAARFTVL